MDGRSLLGFFYYAPVVFSEHNTIGKQQELLLSLGSLILSDVQKIRSDIGIVIFGPDHKSRTLHLKKYRSEIQQLVDEVVDVLNDIMVPKLILNKHCRICRYEKRCLDQAKLEDNLSLIGMGKKDIRKFNRKGIFTVSQLSYTFRPRRRNKRLKTHLLLHYHALQALAIRERKVYIFQKPDMPHAKTQVFVDMEGDAGGSSIYLIGVLLVENGKQTPFVFWADTHAAENEIFAKFCELLSGLDDVHLFHYGSYESRVFKRMLPLVSADRRALGYIHTKRGLQ